MCGAESSAGGGACGLAHSSQPVVPVCGGRHRRGRGHSGEMARASCRVLVLAASLIASSSGERLGGAPPVAGELLGWHAPEALGVEARSVSGMSRLAPGCGLSVHLRQTMGVLGERASRGAGAQGPHSGHAHETHCADRRP